jgi:PAS domain S-box-containing protein
MQDNHYPKPGKTLIEPRFPFGADFQAIISLIGDAVVSTDDDGQIILFNRAAEGFFGYSSTEILGQSIDVIIPTRFHGQHREDHRRFIAALAETRRAMGAGREVLGRRKDGTEFAVEVTLSRHLIDGRHIGTAVIRDVSDRKDEEKQRQLVANEVAHRLRNTMAVVTSIVSLTGRAASSTAEFKNALLGRFAAISRTNESLIRRSWSEASLRELIESELEPYQCDDGRILLKGPDIAIDREVAVALALVVHELATNASKHGALSTPMGRLQVQWQDTAPDGKRVLEMTWRETGGPAVSPPTRRGFGTELIAKSLRGHGGKAELKYLAGGVECVLRLPLV